MTYDKRGEASSKIGSACQSGALRSSWTSAVGAQFVLVARARGRRQIDAVLGS